MTLGFGDSRFTNGTKPHAAILLSPRFIHALSHCIVPKMDHNYFACHPYSSLPPSTTMPMNTRPTSKRLDTYNKQDDAENVNANPYFASSSLPTSTCTATKSGIKPPTKKPQRPLTAYHIFFQIEREYIIQTTAGPSDGSDNSNEEKKLLRNVPSRYANTKLRPDWFAGPGKRKKRKHRKSHGKIGFHELSSLISTRWATLEHTHPDVKKYVHEIAARELDEYKLEMEEYKQLTGNAVSDSNPSSTPTKVTKKRKQVTKRKHKASTAAAKISPPPSPKASYDMCDLKFSTSICTDDEGEDEVDYSISSVTHNGHHIPSPPSETDFSKLVDFSDEAFLDPLFQLSDLEPTQPSHKRQRCVSPPALPDLSSAHGFSKRSSAMWTF